MEVIVTVLHICIFVHLEMIRVCMFISKLGCDNRGAFFVIMKYEEFKVAHLSGTELFNIANHKIIERNSIISRR